MTVAAQVLEEDRVTTPKMLRGHPHVLAADRCELPVLFDGSGVAFLGNSSRGRAAEQRGHQVRTRLLNASSPGNPSPVGCSPPSLRIYPAAQELSLCCALFVASSCTGLLAQARSGLAQASRQCALPGRFFGTSCADEYHHIRLAWNLPVSSAPDWRASTGRSGFASSEANIPGDHHLCGLSSGPTAKIAATALHTGLIEEMPAKHACHGR